MKNIYKLILTLLASVLITACGGGSSSSNVGTTTVTDQQKVDLTWTAPTTRTDETYLPPNELAGFRIYYGTSQENLEMQLDINDENQTAVSITNLPSGTYYFTVTSYDADGLESGFSNVIEKEISS